jgi:hypothetical protein
VYWFRHPIGLDLLKMLTPAVYGRLACERGSHRLMVGSVVLMEQFDWFSERSEEILQSGQDLRIAFFFYIKKFFFSHYNNYIVFLTLIDCRTRLIIKLINNSCPQEPVESCYLVRWMHLDTQWNTNERVFIISVQTRWSNTCILISKYTMAIYMRYLKLLH